MSSSLCIPQIQSHPDLLDLADRIDIKMPSEQSAFAIETAVRSMVMHLTASGLQSQAVRSRFLIDHQSYVPIAHEWGDVP